jgi:hypothetical protein
MIPHVILAQLSVLHTQYNRKAICIHILLMFFEEMIESRSHGLLMIINVNP